MLKLTYPNTTKAVENTVYSQFAHGHLKHVVQFPILMPSGKRQSLIFSSYVYSEPLDPSNNIITFLSSSYIPELYHYQNRQCRTALTTKSEYTIGEIDNRHTEWQWQTKYKDEDLTQHLKIYIPNLFLYTNFDDMLTPDSDEFEIIRRIDNSNVVFDKNSFFASTVPFYMETMIYIIGSHRLDPFLPIKVENKRRKNKAIKRIQNALDYIHLHFMEKINIENLASLALMSPFHFAHCFKHYAGQTPQQYIIRCRLLHAQYLLSTTTLNIDQIAIEVGYNSRNHFALLFKRFEGNTPREYRKKCSQ
ncbi:MAG: helix-turn-helix domain-containing protein [Cellvibrionaceae bacterium]